MRTRYSTSRSQVEYSRHCQFRQIAWPPKKGAKAKNGSQPPWNAPFGAAGAAGSEGSQRPSWSDWPALGPTREHQQRWQRMADAAGRVEQAQRRMQRLWSDTLRQAAVDFAARIKPLPAGAPDPEALRKLYDTWIDCAEKAYAHAAHGEAFCNTQAELVNAGSQWRAELQTSIEQWAKLLDLPTRSEINTLAQRLRELEERVRAQSETPQPKTRPSAARKTSHAPRKRRRPPRGSKP